MRGGGAARGGAQRKAARSVRRHVPHAANANAAAQQGRSKGGRVGGWDAQEGTAPKRWATPRAAAAAAVHARYRARAEEEAGPGIARSRISRGQRSRRRRGGSRLRGSVHPPLPGAAPPNEVSGGCSLSSLSARIVHSVCVHGRVRRVWGGGVGWVGRGVRGWVGCKEFELVCV